MTMADETKIPNVPESDEKTMRKASDQMASNSLSAYESKAPDVKPGRKKSVARKR
jgi:hypothetical protein